MTDYRTLLAVAGYGRPTYKYELDEVDDMLAARIPDLCPDCDQGDVKHLPYSQTCTHPNAPTIADLLQWGENVAKAEAHPGMYPHVQFDHPTNGPTQYHGPIVLLAALRGEGQ